MTDHYKILELDRTATPAQIRAAYKRLAMAYHPDMNGGRKDAEERFKLINEAYHILSDPLKKSRYDNSHQLNYETVLTDAYYDELRKKKFTQWRTAQQASHYRIDKSYFKIQGMAFIVFIILAGFSFSVFHTIEFFVEKERKKQWQENTILLNEVNHLFGKGLFDQAFLRMEELHRKSPTEYRFHFTHDSLISTLRTSAQNNFEQGHYETAFVQYEALHKYDSFNPFKNLERMATCQYYMGNYENALGSLKQLLSQQPEDFGLIYQIGIINLEDLHDPKEAAFYFDLGKKQFQTNLTEIYGQAFEIVMDPKDVPDIYFYLFLARARTNRALEKYTEALADCKWAIYLRRERAEGYSLRAAIKIESNQWNGLCQDLSLAIERNDRQAPFLLQKYCR